MWHLWGLSILRACFFSGFVYLPQTLIYISCYPCRSTSIQRGGGSTKEEISSDHRQHRQNTCISDTSKYLTTKEKTEFNSATRLTFHQVSQPIDNISQNRLFCHTQAEELIRNPDLPLTKRNSTGCKTQNVLIINTHFNRNNRKKACIKDEISNMQLK